MDLIDREQLKSTIRKMVEIPNETRAQVIGAISRAKAIDIVRCKDCEWFNAPGCAIYIVDDTDKPKADDYCSFGERRMRNEES